MIHAEFYESKHLLSGFRLSGHSGYAESGSDIVCAAVSSAVQLTVNLLEEFDCEPQASAEGDTVLCRITASQNTAAAILEQLRLHLESILAQYPDTLKITITEV